MGSVADPKCKICKGIGAFSVGRRDYECDCVIRTRQEIDRICDAVRASIVIHRRDDDGTNK